MAAQPPSDPRELQQFKAMIVEMTHALQRVDSEREHLKAIASEASDQFGIPKKMINKIARTMYKHNYATVQEENEEFELLYESVTNAKSGGSAEAA